MASRVDQKAQAVASNRPSQAEFRSPNGPAPDGPGELYTVKSGDTLRALAEEFLGDEDLWSEIAKTNPQIKNPNKIYPGDQVRIPELDDAFYEQWLERQTGMGENRQQVANFASGNEQAAQVDKRQTGSLSFLQQKQEIDRTGEIPLPRTQQQFEQQRRTTEEQPQERVERPDTPRTTTGRSDEPHFDWAGFPEEARCPELAELLTELRRMAEYFENGTGEVGRPVSYPTDEPRVSVPSGGTGSVGRPVSYPTGEPRVSVPSGGTGSVGRPVSYPTGEPRVSVPSGGTGSVGRPRTTPTSETGVNVPRTNAGRVGRPAVGGGNVGRPVAIERGTAVRGGPHPPPEPAAPQDSAAAQTAQTRAEIPALPLEIAARAQQILASMNTALTTASAPWSEGGETLALNEVNNLLALARQMPAELMPALQREIVGVAREYEFTEEAAAALVNFVRTPAAQPIAPTETAPASLSAEQRRLAARALDRAMDRLGTDEAAIFQTLEGLTAGQIKDVASEYEKMTGTGLDQALRKELSGDELKRAEALVRGDRATADAAALHRAMARWGTDKKGLFAALEKLDGSNVQGVLEAYQREYRQSLEAAIKGEKWDGLFPGDVNRAIDLLDRAVIAAESQAEGEE
ncbi:MAG: LysM peptidoglycan-binding domain-containing protein [Deltaproteobacteria bacterium]|nr:LysM peptidoglycan-binding domain-containing protein [Deltaproteobacteria bacterium]